MIEILVMILQNDYTRFESNWQGRRSPPPTPPPPPNSPLPLSLVIIVTSIGYHMKSEDQLVFREESVRRAEEMFRCLDVDGSGELTEVIFYTFPSPSQPKLICFSIVGGVCNGMYARQSSRQKTFIKLLG